MITDGVFLAKLAKIKIIYYFDLCAHFARDTLIKIICLCIK